MSKYLIKGIAVDDFTWAYIEAALWSSNDESDDQGGDPIDQNYGPEDLDDAALQKMIADCKAFKEANAKKIATWGRARFWRRREQPKTTPDEQAGHDFWLTRNGHGAGFWDGMGYYR
jgi:hypothetical protein